MALHWCLAVALAGAVGVGAYMADLPFSPLRLRLINWHKWAGIAILLLSALRLVWRVTHRPPADLPAPRWQQRAAHATHVVLYLLFFAVPLVGWAYSSAAGFPLVWFGVLPLPDLIGPDKVLAASLKQLHGVLAWSLVWLAGLHVAAALKHQFVDRDGLIDRMRPVRARSRATARAGVGS
jgi:cytochrome b561